MFPLPSITGGAATAGPSSASGFFGSIGGLGPVVVGGYKTDGTATSGIAIPPIVYIGAAIVLGLIVLKKLKK